MSNIYIKEPSTNGKILMKTSVGDIDIELWSREAPIACKNFVQLCLESYYDGVIFHRVVPGFIVQGGDPSGTGTGGESVYGHTFKDELHSRLRFVRRGLVAMANGGPDDNGSQFFFTLGPCNDLNKKHTIFAKVSGDTIYNMIRLGEVETDSDERPINPPHIKSTKVLANPFDDIIPRFTKSKQKSEEKLKKKSKMKATKDFKLLSFGMEAEMDEEETNEFKPKVNSKSSHDLIKDDPTLSTEVVCLEGDNDNKIDQEVITEEKKEENLGYVKDKLKVKQTPLQKNIEELLEEDEENKIKRQNKIEEMQKEAKKLAKELKASKTKEEKKRNKNLSESSSNSDKSESEETTKSNNPLYDDYRKQQKIYRKKTHGNKLKGKSREEQTMLMLSKFQEKLFAKKQKKEEDEKEKDDWLKHEFVAEQDLLRDAKDMNRDITEDRYTLEDPRNPINKRRRGEDKSEKPKRKRR